MYVYMQLCIYVCKLVVFMIRWKVKESKQCMDIRTCVNTYIVIWYTYIPMYVYTYVGM